MQAPGKQSRIKFPAGNDGKLRCKVRAIEWAYCNSAKASWVRVREDGRVNSA